MSRYVRKNSAEAYVVLSVSLGAADSGQLGRMRSQPSSSGMAEMTTDEDLDVRTIIILILLRGSM